MSREHKLIQLPLEFFKQPDETADEHVIEQLTKRMDFAAGLAVGVFLGIVIMAFVGRI